MVGQISPFIFVGSLRKGSCWKRKGSRCWSTLIFVVAAVTAKLFYRRTPLPRVFFPLQRNLLFSLHLGCECFVCTSPRSYSAVSANSSSPCLSCFNPFPLWRGSPASTSPLFSLSPFGVFLVSERESTIVTVVCSSSQPTHPVVGLVLLSTSF